MRYRNIILTQGKMIVKIWSLIELFVGLTVVPILSLAFGSSIDPDNIREDTDVYFECKIHANPWVYKVVWLHNVSKSYFHFIIFIRIVASNKLEVIDWTKFLLSDFILMYLKHHGTCCQIKKKKTCFLVS